MLSSKLKAQIKDKLLKLEKDLIESVESAKKSAKPVELDQQSVGRVSRIDAIQQQQLSLNSLKRQQMQLNQVRQALMKIDSDDFGLCGVCEEQISESRLLARPEHNLCLPCTKTGEKSI